MKVMIFVLFSGFLSVASIAPDTSIPSPTPAPRPANQIAHPAATAAHPVTAVVAGSSPRIWNAIISP